MGCLAPISAAVIGLSLAVRGLAAATGTAPCAAVSASWAAQTAATPRPTVEASLAYDCIKSVPINKPAALKFVFELKPYLEWQSNLAFLKTPPANYQFPPHDVLAALDRVRAGLEADLFPNEHSWQQELFVSVFGAAHDGHLSVSPDILTNAVEWEIPLALVSISEDGIAPPVIKFLDDVVSSPDAASTVTQINGIDAFTFVKDRSILTTGMQDSDAAYNLMFYSRAMAASNKAGQFKQGGRIAYVYPGQATSFQLQNGTSFQLNNIAKLKGDWNGVIDGFTFFERFAPGARTADSTENPTPSPPPTATSMIPSTATRTSVSGYPSPVIISKDAVVSGYFLDEPGLNDVAVLALRSFGSHNPAEFQKVVEDFLVAANAAEKRKLLVDLQANDGGYIFQAYDTFRQIFPDVVQEGTGRLRFSPAFQSVSEVFSRNCKEYDPKNAPDELIRQCESVFNWRYDLNRDRGPFTSYEAKFKQEAFQGDKYTDLLQWNFDNPHDTTNATYGIGFDVTGYRSRAHYSRRPFGGPENIVLLYDGACASACSLFSQFMKETGVKSVAMGGRPDTSTTIQGVGGVKGSQAWSFRTVFEYTQAAKRHSTINDTDLIVQLDRFTSYVESRSSYTSLNVRDEILRKNWHDGIPAQFVVETSDCRLYWLADMLFNISNVWKAAAGAAFKGSKCAFGAGGDSGGSGMVGRTGKRVREVVDCG
ncbi:hypothetical protein B0T14DRAFT_538188 [Immersiella caudata]|uniref:Tail specific protease domain-containing protein n=1 Tax=Immersiella caudata TaxID=314043 RepID=A0AA39WSX9_9PEZI|nr:hypothetical protein B0T14DRAFT_538188 [Immersiella caudata]